jgi:hypothetical protein
MASRLPVVRKCSKISKPQLHDLLMIGWQRAIAKFGKGAFAEALDISTVALDKQLAKSMPAFETIVDAYSFDEDVLRDVLDELGVRIVPKEAACDTDDLNVLLARALVKINEALHPDSPGGRAVVHTEYLDGEEVMRQIHSASGAWLQACADIRRPREVAA